MNLAWRDDLAFHNVAEHEVVVHGVRDDARNRGGGELDEGVVLGASCGAVAGETETSDFAELGEVGAHFVLVETVGDAASRSQRVLVGKSNDKHS